MRTASLLLLLTVCLLVALSLTVQSSAMMLEAKGDSMLRGQGVAVIVGLVAMAFFAFADLQGSHWQWWPRWISWESLAWVSYVVAIVLLVATLSPLGTNRNNAQRWLFGSQPSELGKVAVILMCAWFGSRYQSKMRNPIIGLGGSLLIVAPIAALVFVEPDRGTAFLLGSIALLMALVAGVRAWHLGVAGLLACSVFVFIVSKQTLVRTRLDAFLHPELHKGGASDQAMRSLAALHAGGIDGVGLGLGSVKFRIPEQHTDFILAVVGEELGLWFTLAIIAAFMVIMYCGFSIASKASSRFGQLTASGITILIAVQAMINIAVVTNSMPNKGMPLPFLSRGGSSIAIMLSLVGILLNIAREVGGSKTDAAAEPREDLFSENELNAVPAE